MRNRMLTALNRRLSFELQNRHLWLHSYKLSYENGCKLDHCYLAVKQNQKDPTSGTWPIFKSGDILFSIRLSMYYLSRMVRIADTRCLIRYCRARFVPGNSSIR